VIGTNVTLAMFALIVVLFATTMFNVTIEENGEEIGVMFSKLAGFAGLGAIAGWFTMGSVDGQQSRFSLLKPLVITLFTGAFYALVQPDFGWNERTLVLIAALATSVTLTTFIFEGGQVFWSNRYEKSAAAMQVYPIGILFALVSVALTRVTHLHPGVIFGFVAAAAISPRQPLSARDHGMSVLVPMTCLLAASVIGFLLIDPLRDFEESTSSAWGAYPVTVAVAIFIGGAEGALLSLLPLTFNDGRKIWQWSRKVWFLIALPATFAFIHVIVNEEDYTTLTNGTSTITLLMISMVILAVAAGTWLFFRLREKTSLETTG
jgi:hypothetical protein